MDTNVPGSEGVLGCAPSDGYRVVETKVRSSIIKIDANY